MKFSVRLLATAAVFCAPSMAAASVQQADPDRAAELLCSLGGLCEVAPEEANREVEQDESFDGRGIIGSSDVRNAGSRQTRPTPTPTPTVSRPRVTRPRPVVRRPSVSGRRQPVSVAPEISLEIREKIAAPLVVTFATNSAVLDKTAQSEIASLALAMKQAQELGKPIALRIEGHASRGSARRAARIEPWNQTLSERRAEAVRTALLEAIGDVELGPDQVSSKGYGSSKPLDVDGVKPTDKVNQRVVAVPVE